MTTVASSTCMSSSISSAITAPVAAVSAAASLFKTSTVASSAQRPNTLSQTGGQGKKYIIIVIILVHPPIRITHTVFMSLFKHLKNCCLL